MEASIAATTIVQTLGFPTWRDLRPISWATGDSESAATTATKAAYWLTHNFKLVLRKRTGRGCVSIIPTALISDVCPRPFGNRDHLCDIVDEGVPGSAAGLDDLLICFPNDVTEIVATQVFPDVLDWVQLRGIGWQTEQGDIVRNGQAVTGLMPASAIADQHAVGGRTDDLADLGQVHAHDFAADPRHYHSCADGPFRANRSEQPGGVVPIVTYHRRA